MTIRAGAAVASAVLVAVAGALLAASASRAVPVASGGRLTYTGTWSAAGTRETLPAAGNRTAVTVHVAGAIVLAADGPLGRGLQGEVIGFDNGAGVTAGSAVWTDGRGDRIFSDLTGDLLQSSRRITGTITGGTGKYAGATGAYELTWLYVLSGEDAGVQGRAIDLRGWISLDGAP
jgi:hypothetical protein